MTARHGQIVTHPRAVKLCKLQESKQHPKMFSFGVKQNRFILGYMKLGFQISKPCFSKIKKWSKLWHNPPPPGPGPTISISLFEPHLGASIPSPRTHSISPKTFTFTGSALAHSVAQQHGWDRMQSLEALEHVQTAMAQAGHLGFPPACAGTEPKKEASDQQAEGGRVSA